MYQYLGASSMLTTAHRALGIPPEFAAQFGDAPLVSVGFYGVWVGDLLFKTSKLRTAASFEKILNAYPSSRIFENWRFMAQFGYYVAEQESNKPKGLKAYPFLGYSWNLYYIDNSVRMSILSVDGGAGADWFIPQTPVLVGVQASYNHSWNLSAAKEVVNNVSGLSIKAHIAIFIFEKKNPFGWN
ncbi:MAG: hypothetical protein EAZ92_06175 [Candidatus Kapaibacterium sp.]|nr:MAG: hypothetical protein EAZ92_06175 [Candidatus Kapabacteria bacterium]